jgi:hypothetical protein
MRSPKQASSKHRSLLQAYARQRTAGQADIGSILLAVASDLQAFNFRETFTDAFEVRLQQNEAEHGRDSSAFDYLILPAAAWRVMAFHSHASEMPDNSAFKHAGCNEYDL